MKHIIAILGTTMLLAGGAAQAAGSPVEERVGVGIGVTIGAVAGGPVGAVVGAAIGAKFGDSYHRKNRQIDQLSASLDKSSGKVSDLEATIADLNRDVSVLDSDLRRLRSQARPELLALLQAGIEMDLLFRTDERVLTDGTESRITQLATTLAAMPDIRVQLDGYADERGDETYNRQLSAERAAAVRQLFVDSGVAPERIAVNAHGELDTPDESPDSLAFARKVSVTLSVEPASSLAAATH